jgi:hypothetical protein
VSRRSDRLIRSFHLAPVEAAYLRQVDDAGRALSGTTRRGYVAAVAELLGERPPSASFDQLEEGIGSPAALVNELREADGLPPQTGVLRRWWDLGTIWRIASAVVLVALVVGGFLVGRYYTEVPEFTNNCGATRAASFERREAAGVSEVAIEYSTLGRFGVGLCVSTDASGVEILAIRAPQPGEWLFQPVGVEEWDLGGGEPGNASAFVPFRGEATRLSGRPFHILWFEFDHCGSWQRGSGGGTSTFELEYRYRSRTRTSTVHLIEVVTVVASCSAEDTEADRVATERYRAYLDTNSDIRWWELEPFMLGLDHENVSRDLCRYLRFSAADGVEGPVPQEPLSSRAVFQIDNVEVATDLVDAALVGFCPEFSERRDELVGMLGG